jgi:hypothetical protein
MDLEPLLLSCIQFAFVVSFHIIFPAFTIGLAAWLATIEGMRLATGNPVYRRVFDFWRVLNLSRAFDAMRRSLPSFEMLNPRNLRSSGRAAALFAFLALGSVNCPATSRACSARSIHSKASLKFDGIWGGSLIAHPASGFFHYDKLT